MLKFLGWVIKASLFAAVVLILGNVLHIGGRTVSDQVKTSLSHAEQLAPTNTLEQVKTWSGDMADKAKRAAEELKKPARHSSSQAERPRKPIQGKITKNTDPNKTEDILASERQELRTLIRQLNTSTEKLTAN